MSGAGAQPPPAPGASPGGSGGDSELPPSPPSMLSVDLPGLLSQFARSFALVFPIYLLGYLGLSFSWVLAALLCFFWVQRHRGGKNSRLGRALAFLQDEERAVRLTVSTGDLPAWVHFPDTEEQMGK
ncbi:extended synaptotagmin-2-like [Crotalus tigris]|uniref:extended synaptotagmin-2-like n=1 Tax=Crotalus tigris TaxID=88082 RepID=UPI00192F18CE|nr:extended synaptotagmin-2-like [Crotalus tigris]